MVRKHSEENSACPLTTAGCCMMIWCVSAAEPGWFHLDGIRGRRTSIHPTLAHAGTLPLAGQLRLEPPFLPWWDEETMPLDIGNDALALHHPLEAPQRAVNGFIRRDFDDGHACYSPPCCFIVFLAKQGMVV